jgi:hypothetical protein
MNGVRDSLGTVSLETADKSIPGDDDEATDVRAKFPTVEAKTEAALGAYRLASSQYVGTGAGILAKLGEANELLDRRDFDGAQRVFREVLETPLAGADTDVRLNATEGVGQALEGKGDFDGALKAYKTLENSDVRGFVELGLYHQGRIYLVDKDQKDTAKALLLKARDRLSGAQGDKTTDTAAPSVKHDFLSTRVNALLREIDPTLAAPAAAANPYDQLTPDQLRELRKLYEKMRHQQQPSMPMEPKPNEGSSNPGPAPQPAPAPGGSDDDEK